MQVYRGLDMVALNDATDLCIQIAQARLNLQGIIYIRQVYISEQHIAQINKLYGCFGFGFIGVGLAQHQHIKIRFSLVIDICIYISIMQGDT